jgi:hypothetical protein
VRGEKIELKKQKPNRIEFKFGNSKRPKSEATSAADFVSVRWKIQDALRLVMGHLGFLFTSIQSDV